MNYRKAVTAFLVAAILLAVASLVIGAFAALLQALGDEHAAAVVRWVAFSLGALWVLDLIALLLAVAVVHHLESPTESASGSNRHEPHSGTAEPRSQASETTEESQER